MSHYSILVTFLFIISMWSPTASARARTTIYSTRMTSTTQHGLTTPAPSVPSGFELRKRKDTPGSICGWSQRKDGSWDTWSVLSPYFCAGTILPNGSAFAFSSDAEVGSQYMVYTAAVGDWDTEKSCPLKASTTCCSGINNIVQTYYFIASTYTITSWWCSSTALTQTWNPATNLLDTRDFSTSLAQATASTSTTPAPSSGGLSSQTKIGIGIGIAGTAGVVLMAVVLYCFWRRGQKGTKRTPDAASQMTCSLSAHYGPGASHNAQPWYNDRHFEYYQQDGHLSTPPARPLQAVRLQELHGESRTGEPQELHEESKTDTVREQPRQELSAEP